MAVKSSAGGGELFVARGGERGRKCNLEERWKKRGNIVGGGRGSQHLSRQGKAKPVRGENRAKIPSLRRQIREASRERRE